MLFKTCNMEGGAVHFLGAVHCRADVGCSRHPTSSEYGKQSLQNILRTCCLLLYRAFEKTGLSGGVWESAAG